MKNYLSAALICFVLLLNACTKSGKSIIEGKWSVVSDNKTLTGGPLTGSETYIGKNDDYFDFRTNNILYIKENGYYDTAQYNLQSGDKINLIGKNFSSTVSTEASGTIISANKATIVVYPAGIISPAGAIKRTINLKR